MKRCLILVIVMEIKIKITLSQHLIYVKWVLSKRTRDNKYTDEIVKKRESLYSIIGKLMQPLLKFLKKLKRKLSYD